MKRIVSILLFSALLTHSLLAQKLTVQVSKNKVAVGETFQISFSLNTNGSNFRPPNLIADFEVYSGPNQSTSMSYINGTMSQSVTFSYILAAKKEGKLTIGSASINAGGNNVQSSPIVIEVVKGNGNGNARGNTNNSQQQSQTGQPSENIGDNLFSRIIVNKTKAFLGEQITVSYKVYSRYQLRGFQDIKFPDYNGFWSQDQVMNTQQINVTNENIDGITYQVAELKRSYIFAQRTGKLKLEPMQTSVVIRKQSNRRPHDIFEQFFGGGYEDVAYDIKSQPVTIDIQALPETNKPTDFSGAVGDFSYKVQLSKEKVKANEAVNLIITLSGKGNIKLVEPPKINFPEDFEIYDPKTKDNITVNANGVNGSKTFDYLIIPRHEGDYTIDQINFSYFDPVKKEYITIPAPDFKLHVDKGDGSSAIVTSNPTRKEDLKELGKDIRYIKTDSRLQSKNSYFFGSFLFYSGLIIPIIGFLVFLFLRRKNIELNKDAIAVKSRKATKMAKKRLSIAEQHLKTNNKEQFYVEIFQALYGYISNKLNIPISDLNKEHISEKLKIKNVSENTIQELIRTIDNCEYARYAPSAASGDLNSIYNKTVELITKIEDEIK